MVSPTRRWLWADSAVPDVPSSQSAMMVPLPSAAAPGTRVEPFAIDHWDERVHKDASKAWGTWVPPLWFSRGSTPHRRHALNGDWFLERHGALAFSSIVSRALLRPSAAWPTPGDAASGGSPFAPRCVGVHVRRGDSCGDLAGYRKGKTRVCPPLDAYLDAAQRLATLAGYDAARCGGAQG